jgi:hypothetical protein
MTLNSSVFDSSNQLDLFNSLYLFFQKVDKVGIVTAFNSIQNLNVRLGVSFEGCRRKMDKELLRIVTMLSSKDFFKILEKEGTEMFARIRILKIIEIRS